MAPFFVRSESSGKNVPRTCSARVFSLPQGCGIGGAVEAAQGSRGGRSVRNAGLKAAEQTEEERQTG